MTPQEIFEYKNRWKPHAYQVDIHSDLDIQCKDWCRKHCERWQWSMESYTDVYQHTFYFEHDLHGKEFCVEFKDWIKSNESKD